MLAAVMATARSIREKMCSPAMKWREDFARFPLERGGSEAGFVAGHDKQLTHPR